MNKKEMLQLSLMTEVASMYYEKGMTQEEIGKALYLSRTRISRILKKAEEMGVKAYGIRPSMYEILSETDKNIDFSICSGYYEYSGNAGFGIPSGNACRRRDYRRFPDIGIDIPAVRSFGRLSFGRR